MYLFLYFGCAGSCLLLELSPVEVNEGYSLLVQASHCGGSSPLESAGLWFLREGDLLSCPEVLRVSFHAASLGLGSVSCPLWLVPPSRAGPPDAPAG